MSKRFFYAFLFVAVFYAAYGQTDTCNKQMTGYILDHETEEPIEHVVVRLKDSEKQAITDSSGYFKIDGLCSENNALIISCLGYCDSVCEHHHDHEVSPHIYLKRQVSQLEKLIISVERKGLDVHTSIQQDIITKADLSLATTPSLAASLAQVPGLRLVSRGPNVQLPVIHGLYGNRILILTNGFRHGFQNWGNDHAPEVNLSNAYKVTVVKGAAGVRFGPEALGGAVNIETNPLYLKSGYQLNTKLTYQSNGKGGLASFNMGEGYKRWAYALSASLFRIGDQHAPDYILTNTGKQEGTVSAGLRYHHKKFDAKLRYQLLSQNLGLLRSSVAESGNAFIRAIESDTPQVVNPFSYDIQAPNQLNTHQYATGEANWLYKKNASLNLKAARQVNKRQEFDVRRNIDKPIIDLVLTTHDIQLDWKHAPFKGIKGLIGSQFFNQDNNNIAGTGVTPFVPNYNTNRFAAFLIEGLERNETTYEIGVRLEHETNSVRGRNTSHQVYRDAYSFTNVTATIGVDKHFSKTTQFRSNVGTAWRPPNMVELYGFGQHGFKLSYGLLRYSIDGLGQLNTATITQMQDAKVQVERGIKWVNEWKRKTTQNEIMISGYVNLIDHYTYERPQAIIGTVRGPMPTFVYAQTNAVLAGIDATWDKSWTKKLKGILNYSYVHARDVANNQALINQPPMYASYRLTAKTRSFGPVGRSKLVLEPSYTFRQTNAPMVVSPRDLIEGNYVIASNQEIFDFTAAPQGYFLLNVGWQFGLGMMDVKIDLRNALNQFYRDYLNGTRYFADELGTNIFVSLVYKFIKTQDEKNKK